MPPSTPASHSSSPSPSSRNPRPIPSFLRDGKPYPPPYKVYEDVKYLLDEAMRDLKDGRDLWRDIVQLHIAARASIQIARIAWFNLQVFDYAYHPDELQSWYDTPNPKTGRPYHESVPRGAFEGLSPYLHDLIEVMLRHAENALPCGLVHARAAASTVNGWHPELDKAALHRHSREIPPR